MVNFSIPDSELRKLNKALGELSSATGKTLKDVIRQESALLAVDMVNYTPPVVANNPNNFRNPAPNAQRIQGEQAVEKDIRRMFQPLDSISAVNNSKSKGLNNAITQALKVRDWTGLAEVLFATGILPFKPKIIETADPALHRKYRNRRGKVLKSIKNPWLVVDGKSIDKYVVKQQKKVGSAKGGWVKVLRGFGRRVSGWIDKGPRSGEFTKKDTAFSVEYTMANQMAYAQKHYPNIVARAVKERLYNITHRVTMAFNKDSTLRRSMRF